MTVADSNGTGRDGGEPSGVVEVGAGLLSSFPSAVETDEIG